MNWLTKLMYGRYGTDRLGLFMLIVVLLLDIIFTFTGWDVLYILAFVLAAICVWRIFSRNISRRYAENQKFMQLTDPIVRAISSKISGLKDLRTHRHLRCPSCGQKIRVPKGRGKIQIIFCMGILFEFFCFLGYTGINRIFLIRRHVP